MSALGMGVRRVLGELDVNADLPRRTGVKRPPITMDAENEEAVRAGIASGIYNWDEILEVTNNTLPDASATADDAQLIDDGDLAGEIAGEELIHIPQEIHDDVGVGFGTELENGMDPNDIPSDDMGDEDLGEELGEDEDADDPHDLPVGDQSPVAFFDPAAMGLKEINNLAHFGVSSHKPGNGVDELLSDDLDKYWQSDGQQPHLLTMHFLRRVEIRAIRFYVDYHQDESYTPTHIIFYAGTGHHDLLQFAEVTLNNPTGWQDVPLAGCGGGADGNALCCWIVQMHVKENHQNGKDTHIRGIKVFALDESAADGGVNGAVAEMVAHIDDAAEQDLMRQMQDPDALFGNTLDALVRNGRAAGHWYRPSEGGFSSVPDFMRDPEIR